jgi:hypothetical protein
VAADWLVGAEDGSGCCTVDVTPISLDPCEELDVALVLAECSG